MKVTLHGVRGSIPSPLKNKEYKEKALEILHHFSHSSFSNTGDLKSFWQTLPPHLRYTAGGDTTCVSVVSDSGKTYVIDFGTGARSLGDDLVPKILSSKVFDFSSSQTKGEVMIETTIIGRANVTAIASG